MIGSGAFDRRVTIRRRVQARDGATDAVVEAWGDFLTNVPANFKQISGREYLEGNQVVSARKAVFTVRWLPDIQATDRVAYEGAEFNIQEIRELGRRRFYELHAELIQ